MRFYLGTHRYPWLGTMDVPLFVSHRQLRRADSMAWSYAARNRPVRLPGCVHPTCANCPVWAMQWRESVLAEIGTHPYQGTLL